MWERNIRKVIPGAGRSTTTFHARENCPPKNHGQRVAQKTILALTYQTFSQEKNIHARNFAETKFLHAKLDHGQEKNHVT